MQQQTKNEGGVARVRPVPHAQPGHEPQTLDARDTLSGLIQDTRSSDTPPQMAVVSMNTYNEHIGFMQTQLKAWSDRHAELAESKQELAAENAESARRYHVEYERNAELSERLAKLQKTMHMRRMNAVMVFALGALGCSGLFGFWTFVSWANHVSNPAIRYVAVTAVPTAGEFSPTPPELPGPVVNAP